MTNGADPGKGTVSIPIHSAVIHSNLSCIDSIPIHSLVTPFQSIKPHPHKATCEDEDRLEMLFDRPYQMEWEEQHANELVSGDSLQSKMAALNEREDEGITKTTSKGTYMVNTHTHTHTHTHTETSLYSCNPSNGTSV